MIDQKEATKRYRDKLRKERPWFLTLFSVRSRCNGKNTRYFKKGIKNYLTEEKIKYIWLRDKAGLLDKPSIDRINNDGNYTLDNCRFIEMKENQRLGGKIGGKLKSQLKGAK